MVSKFVVAVRTRTRRLPGGPRGPGMPAEGLGAVAGRLRNLWDLGPKPYEFIGFGAIQGPKRYKFIGSGGIHGPKPYELIGFVGQNTRHPNLLHTSFVLFGVILGGLGWPRPPHKYPKITPTLPPQLPHNYPAFVVISTRVGDHWVALPVLRIWRPK